MVMTSILTLQGPKRRKTKKKDKKHRASRQKKDPAFHRRQRAGNERAQKHFILGGGLFGLLPNSILEGFGDSLCSSEDRYTYTISVPNMYNIVGRERVAALCSECWHEAWQASCKQQAMRAIERKKKEAENGRKQRGNMILLGEPHLRGLGL